MRNDRAGSKQLPACGIALQLNHDAIAVLVTLVTNVRYALNTLVTYEIGHFFNQTRLVDLIRHFGDDQRLTVFADGFGVDLATNNDGAAPGFIG